MRKILLTTIALAVLSTSSVFAESAAKSITPAVAKASQSLKMNWDLSKANDAITLSNDTGAAINMYIASSQCVMRSNEDPGTHMQTNSCVDADPVTVTGCFSGTIQTVQPGSFIACEIQPSAKVTIQVDAKSLKNGAAGVYTTK